MHVDTGEGKVERKLRDDSGQDGREPSSVTGVLLPSAPKDAQFRPKLKVWEGKQTDQVRSQGDLKRSNYMGPDDSARVPSLFLEPSTP